MKSKVVKKYGVKGLMEWQANIKVGRSMVHIHFEGGSSTGYGVNPAEYITGDPVIQHIIEGSEYFKKGKIILMRKWEEAVADNEVKDVPKPKVVAAAVAAAPAAPKPAEKQFVEKEFACLDDAKNYLSDTYGLAKSSLRSRSAIEQAGKANGLNILIKG